MYRNGFNAELMGKTSTAVQAYTSPGIAWLDRARIPKMKKSTSMLFCEYDSAYTWCCLLQLKVLAIFAVLFKQLQKSSLKSLEATAMVSQAETILDVTKYSTAQEYNSGSSNSLGP